MEIEGDLKQLLCETLGELVSDALVLVSPNRQILWCSEAFAQLVERPRPDLVGKSALELFTCLDSLSGAAAESCLNSPEGESINLSLKTASGFEKEIEVRLQTPSSTDASIDGYLLCFCRDLTRERVIETQLKTARRVETIEMIVAGLAHDLNNMLGAISGSVAGLRRLVENDDKANRRLTVVERALERACELNTRILRAAKHEAIDMRAVNPRELIEDAIDLLQRKRKVEKSIEFALLCPDSIPAVRGSPLELLRVFLNLGTNACDAIESEGSISFECSEVTLEESLARERVELKSGGYVRVRVTDTGIGLPAALAERVFDPFFTTKKPDEGSGLGLPVSRAIVEAHGGTLTLSSSKPKETVFECLLPAWHG